MAQKLQDRKAVLAIANRLDRVIAGNFGDVVPVGEGVSEMRIFIGPGYRLYYTIHHNTTGGHVTTLAEFCPSFAPPR